MLKLENTMHITLILALLTVLLSGCLFDSSDTSSSEITPSTRILQTENDLLSYDTLQIASLNMAIGFDLTGLMGAANEDALYNNLLEVYAQFDSSMAHHRIGIIADSIAHYQPDVIALQEVMILERPGTDTADFIAQLMDSLAAKGVTTYIPLLQKLNYLSYTVTSLDSTYSIDSTLTSIDTNTLNFTFSEGNGFLYKNSYTALSTDSMMYNYLFSYSILSENRKSERAIQQLTLQEGAKRKWQVNNTHFEVFFNNYQAEELKEYIASTFDTATTQIIIGDLNTTPTNNGQGLSYQILTTADSSGMFDLWDTTSIESRYTYGLDLRATAPVLTGTLDYIFARNYLSSTNFTIHPLGPEIREGVSLSAADHAFIQTQIIAQY